MLHQLVESAPFNFVPHLHDVEILNQQATQRRFRVTKLSFPAYFQFRDSYELLDVGAALGYGCGPLLVARKPDLDLLEARIAVPGIHTTANLLLRLWNPDIKNITVTRFDRILPGIASGEFDAGVIIHEGRFIYPASHCRKIIDLGEWWKVETSLPIPLGCISALKDPGTPGLKEDLERIIRSSILYAFANRDASREFVKAHAQELDNEVIDSHITLYVNDFSLSLGDTGRQAIETLKKMAQCQKLL